MSLRLIRQNLPNKPGGIGVLANGLWSCDGVAVPLSREIPDGFDDRRDRVFDEISYQRKIVTA